MTYAIIFSLKRCFIRLPVAVAGQKSEIGSCPATRGGIDFYLHMPNWCYNSVQVKGSPDDLKRLVEGTHGDNQPLSFAKVMPPPEGIYDSDETRKPGTMPDWYEWCCEHWGTKWDIDSPVNNEVGLEVTAAELNYLFHTAWSPALPVFDEIAKKHPGLAIDYIYCDESMDIGGRALWEKGEFKMHAQLSSSDQEFDCVLDGYRLHQKGIRSTAWAEEIPVADEFAEIAEKGKAGNGGGGLIGGGVREETKVETTREQKIRDIHLKIENTDRLKDKVAKEVVAVAERLGFPRATWEESGVRFDRSDFWDFPASVKAIENDDKPAGLIPAEIYTKPKKKSAGEGKGKPQMEEEERRIILKSGLSRMGMSSKPVHQLGGIRLYTHGVEIISPNGWSVQGLIKDGESGFVIIRHGNVFQNPPWGDPACAEFKVANDSNLIFKSREAFCSDGKLWDPSKEVAAVREWYPSGALKKESRYFSNKNTAKDGRPSAVYYNPDGTIAKTENKNLRAKGVRKGAKTKVGGLERSAQRSTVGFDP
jgi:hypothetical protein